MGLVYLVVAAMFGMIGYMEYVNSKRRRCDACRLDDSHTMIPHTCSRRNQLYRDPRGNVYEFGKWVRRES